MHGEDQSHQPEIVIAVKVADKYVIDAMEINLQAHKLHLSTLSTIDQE
jgi:hypothetical protein